MFIVCVVLDGGGLGLVTCVVSLLSLYFVLLCVVGCCLCGWFGCLILLVGFVGGNVVVVLSYCSFCVCGITRVVFVLLLF